MAVGAGLTIGVALGIPASADAVDFNVNSLADPGDGTCDTTCTLRDALDDAAANDNSPTVDHILFDSSITGSPGTITLNGTELPLIDEPLYIQGPVAGTLTVSGNDASRILHIYTAAGDDVTVSGLTLSGGRTNTQFARGGAISSRNADLTLQNATVSGNSTTANDAGGGALYSIGGTTTIQNSTISGNSTIGSYSGGGALVSLGATTTTTIQNSTISGNSTTGASGAYGGAVLTYDGTTTIETSTISGNSTAGSGADGGGLSSFGGTTTIDGSTISGNSTSGDSAAGGGLASTSGTMTVRSSTISGNSTAGSGADGGGIYSYYDDINPTLANAIVANNSAAATGPELASFGDTFQASFSLIENTSGATINTTAPGSNIFGVDPQLGPLLAGNGGPTATHALMVTSPVIDCGSSGGATTDQRGSTRPVDLPGRTNSTASGADGADMGAYELQSGAVSGACLNNAPPPTPTPTPTPPATGPTGQRAAALKKCKKKPKGAKRTKCRKKAKRLPV